MDTTRTVAFRDDAAVRSMWRIDHPMEQAFRLLHAIFVIAPIIAGVDKFFNGLIDWSQYLAPTIPSMLGVSPQTFMYGAGAVEIAAGIAVGLMPRFAAYVVAAWLAGIIVNLFMRGYYFDVALRDFGLLVGALALGRMAEARHRAMHGMERETETVVTETTPLETRRVA
jgi:uncharacterized membrane protein YphA (DoxX/SURF4 family)